MSRHRVLMQHAENLDSELRRNFPRVEIFGALVVGAISTVNLNRRTSAQVLDDTGLVHQLVKAA